MTNVASCKSILKVLRQRDTSPHISKCVLLFQILLASMVVCHVQHLTKFHLITHSVVSTGYYCHRQYKYDHLLPVPTMYVLVPCSVMGPGLEHNTRIIRDESLDTDGIVAAIVIYLCYITTQHIYWLFSASRYFERAADVVIIGKDRVKTSSYQMSLVSIEYPAPNGTSCTYWYYLTLSVLNWHWLEPQTEWSSVFSVVCLIDLCASG